MHLRIGLMIAAAAGVPLAPPASAQTLTPTSNWNVDYGNTQCSAARQFGPPAQQIVLALVPALDGRTYQLLVSVPRKGPLYAESSTGTVDLGQGPVAAPVLYYGGKGVQFSNYQFRLPANALAAARSASSIKISTRSAAQFDFVVGDMSSLFDALTKCTADLQQYWNYSGEKVRTPARSLGDMHFVFSSNDYPSEAMFKGQGGTGQYLLQVDEAGAVAGCDVVKASGVPILDVAGCEVIKERTRFSPARDAEGKPLRSVVVTPPVRWEIADNIFNSACTWNLARDGIILNTCARRPELPRPLFRPLPRPPAPPPSGTSGSASLRAGR